MRGGAAAPRFLDVLDRVEYLVELGVTAVQPLPIVEFSTRFSQGYNGTDYFSAEFLYSSSNRELDRYLATANRLLSSRGRSLNERTSKARPTSFAFLTHEQHKHVGSCHEQPCGHPSSAASIP
jgi:hypothetical protein